MRRLVTLQNILPPPLQQPLPQKRQVRAGLPFRVPTRLARRICAVKRVFMEHP